MNKIIYDSTITGHHSEYISHIIDFLVCIDSNDKYFFIVNGEFLDKFPEIIEQSKGISHIKWIFIPKDEINKISRYGMFMRSFMEFKLVNNYAKALIASHVYLMYFNVFQLSLSIIMPKFTVSGILFLQFYRMSKSSLKERLKYYRKYLITKFYARNARILDIFILNDLNTVKYLNNEFRTSKFKMLPDPIPQITPLKNFEIRKHYGIEVSRKIFLHIGSLGERKGTFEIIDSLKYVGSEKRKEICILLVGKSSSIASDKLLRDKIQESQIDSDIKIIWDNQFVPNSMMRSLFDQSDVVLMPYKNAEASSGILGHAMNSRVPVISTGTGLLRELISEFNAGMLLDEVSAMSIAKAIESIDTEVFNDNPNLINFVEEHLPTRFVSKLLRIKR